MTNESLADLLEADSVANSPWGSPTDHDDDLVRDDLVQFFQSVLDCGYDTLLLVARKALLLYEAVKSDLDNPFNTLVSSHRILHTDPDLLPERGAIAIVDDTSYSGASLGAVYSRLREVRPSLTIFVHVLYRSGSETVTTSLADGFVSEPRTGSISEMASFAAAGARIIQRNSGAYLTDFPRLKADLAFSEAGTLSPALSNNWQIVKLTTSCQSRAGVQSFCLLPRRQALPALRSMCPAIEPNEPELIQFRVIARRSEPHWVEIVPKFTLGHIGKVGRWLSVDHVGD